MVRSWTDPHDLGGANLEGLRGLEVERGVCGHAVSPPPRPQIPEIARRLLPSRTPTGRRCPLLWALHKPAARQLASDRRGTGSRRSRSSMASCRSAEFGQPPSAQTPTLWPRPTRWPSQPLVARRSCRINHTQNRAREDCASDLQRQHSARMTREVPEPRQSGGLPNLIWSCDHHRRFITSGGSVSLSTPAPGPR